MPSYYRPLVLDFAQVSLVAPPASRHLRLHKRADVTTVPQPTGAQPFPTVQVTTVANLRFPFHGWLNRTASFTQAQNEAQRIVSDALTQQVGARYLQGWPLAATAPQTLQMQQSSRDVLYRVGRDAAWHWSFQPAVSPPKMTLSQQAAIQMILAGVLVLGSLVLAGFALHLTPWLFLLAGLLLAVAGVVAVQPTESLLCRSVSLVFQVPEPLYREVQEAERAAQALTATAQAATTAGDHLMQSATLELAELQGPRKDAIDIADVEGLLEMDASTTMPEETAQIVDQVLESTIGPSQARVMRSFWPEDQREAWLHQTQGALQEGQRLRTQAENTAHLASGLAVWLNQAAEQLQPWQQIAATVQYQVQAASQAITAVQTSTHAADEHRGAIGRERRATEHAILIRLRDESAQAARALHQEPPSKIATFIMDAFIALGGDDADAVQSARSFGSVQDWRREQATQVAAGGAAANLVPGAHVLFTAGELLFLIHKMAWCAWGIGGILGCAVEGKDDMLLIMGLWSHSVTADQLKILFADVRVATLLKHELDTDPTVRARIAVHGSEGVMAAVTVGSFIAPIALDALRYPVVVNGVQLTAAHLAAALPHLALAASQAIPQALVNVGADGASELVVHLVNAATHHSLTEAMQHSLGNILTEFLKNHFGTHASAAMQHAITPALQHIAHAGATTLTNAHVQKTILGFIPFIGAAATAGINVWALQRFAEAANTYYTLKRDAGFR